MIKPIRARSLLDQLPAKQTVSCLTAGQSFEAVLSGHRGLHYYSSMIFTLGEVTWLIRILLVDEPSHVNPCRDPCIVVVHTPCALTGAAETKPDLQHFLGILPWHCQFLHTLRLVLITQQLTLCKTCQSALQSKSWLDHNHKVWQNAILCL